jgi:Tol biopolymer transport system component
VVADIDSPEGFKVLIPSSQGVKVDFAWHPDNKRVLFPMHSPELKKSQLYTMDRTTDEPPRLLPGQPAGWNIVSCAWSHDGKQIAFTGEKIPRAVEWPLVDKSAE